MVRKFGRTHPFTLSAKFRGGNGLGSKPKLFAQRPNTFFDFTRKKFIKSTLY